MSEAASRWLFLAEIVVLALPGLLVMTIYAVLIGGYSLVGAGALVVMALTGGLGSGGDALSALGMAGLMLGVLAAAILGLMAIVAFARAAIRFLRRGRAGFARERRRFRRGLAYAALPLAIMLPFGWLATQGEHPVDKVVGLYVSGLVLLPPILHLWLELGAAPAGNAHP